MNLKKLKLLSVIGIFLTNFLSHYVYKFFPNNITAIFFPVNESIWEHMKMLYTSIIIYSFIELIILKKANLLYHNFLFMVLFSSILIIPIFLSLYLPFYKMLGENLAITIFIMFISICIIEFLSYFILKNKKIPNLTIFSLMLIIISYIIFGYLTYFPLETELFIDKVENKYGINKYIIGK